MELSVFDAHEPFTSTPLLTTELDEATGAIRAIWDGRHLTDSVDVGRRAAVILDRTCFYGEQGGQVGDLGTIHVGRESSSGHDHAGVFEVEDTRRVGDFVLHVGRVTNGRLKTGDEAELSLDADRRAGVRAHHTATHLLNHALRHVAGPDSDQRGSLVAADRLRFDYAASRALDLDALAERLEDDRRKIEGEEAGEDGGHG